MTEELLTGGINAVGVVKVGNSVRRPQTARSDFVRDLLIHLGDAGLSTVPRHLGIDDKGRHILSYVEGSIDTSWREAKYSSAILIRVAKMLRQFHDATATASFLTQGQEVISHNDFGPWNVIFQSEWPVAIIDFDSAAPGARIRDLSYGAWCWLGLGTESFTPQQQARRLHTFTTAYGATNLVDFIEEIAKRQTEVAEEHDGNGRLERAELCRADQRWVLRNQDALMAQLRNDPAVNLGL